jgi:hypothetical protein
MSATARPAKPDPVGVAAVDVARAALVDWVGEVSVGGPVGHQADAERVVTHYFECRDPGYRGWRWAVTVARAPRQRSVTVDEIVLLPGDDAIVAPAWVPYRERIVPGDLSPGDVLPVADDDARLAPGWLATEEGEGANRQLAADEPGLGRSRVLSVVGRELAAQRWYDGDHGPDTPLARSAPGRCSTCGFLVLLAGPLSAMFGVCANAFANDDGRVVSLDHGCGAHSEAQLSRRQQPQPLPEPVLDTVTWDELDTF